MNAWFATMPQDRQLIVLINGRPILFRITGNWRIEIQYQPGLIHLVRIGLIGPSFVLIWDGGEMIDTFARWADESGPVTDEWLMKKIIYHISLQMLEDPGSETRLEFARQNPILLRHLSQWMYEDSFGVWPDNGDYPEADQYSHILEGSTNG